MKKTPLSSSQKDYQKLFSLSKHTSLLQGVVSLLNWDQETYMPAGASNARSEQLEAMSGIIHREKTNAPYKRILSKLIDIPTGKIIGTDLSAEQQAALKEWRRDYKHNTSLPSSFVEEFTKVTSQALVAWRNAKEGDSFQQFAPFLDRIVHLNRKKADLLGYEDHPYDALLDEYEPDIKTKEVDALFSQLRTSLTHLIKHTEKHPVDDSFLEGRWEFDKQMAFSNKILSAMGYNLNYGRVDFSSHPFSSAAHPTDSRITTRIHPTSLISNIFVILHEAGHALYEMGLPQEQFGSPLGEARSLGIHESQSRWWETRIGMSKPFWQHFFPLLKNTFPVELSHISLDQFYQAINKVKPTFIRVEADELTYPLHVILRFELEKGLIEGSLKVRDIPEAWNAKMKEYLGITPETNREGCLQDIHWAMGAFGYFPTYTLGNLYAAHLFEAFVQEYPDWEKKVAAGELEFIRLWLHDHIYRHGKRYSTQELLKRATGKPFSAEPYLHYLKNKYGK